MKYTDEERLAIGREIYTHELTNRVNIKVTNLDAEHFTTFGDIVNILDGYFLIRVHYFLYKGG